jgi:uncharacterized membrane protein YphA (DoxX/SURF4 family)
MSRTRWRWFLVIALRLVITVLFLPAILAKLRHPAEWAHLFTTWGYPAWGAVAISTLEIVALITLWIPTLTMAAMAVLMVTLSGAAGTWLIHGPRGTAAYPGTILLLVALLAWLQARIRRGSR